MRSAGPVNSEFGLKLTADEAHRLSQFQRSYTSDNTNARRAYEYFHELNKYQYYVTVIKEYEEF